MSFFGQFFLVFAMLNMKNLHSVHTLNIFNKNSYSGVTLTESNRHILIFFINSFQFSILKINFNARGGGHDLFAGLM